MSSENQVAPSQAKRCPLCKEEINKEATKCKHCGTDLQKLKVTNFTNGCLGIVVLVIILVFAVSCINSPSSSSTSKTTETATDKSVAIGENGYIRISGETNPDQKICLGREKEDAKKITDALIAKDVLGVMENPGTFCVGEGTQVLVIEKSFFYTKVRILKGSSDLDTDKVGKSGWLPSDRVSK